MQAGVIVLVALMLSSTMLTTLLAIGWASFGRPRHALVWAIAFAVASVQWALNILYFFQAPGQPLWIAAIDSMSVTVSALILLGFRERVGRGVDFRALLGAALIAIGLVIGCATLWDHEGLRDATVPLFGAGTKFAAAMLVRRGAARMNGPERATTVMLILFGLFDLFGAAAGLLQGARGDLAYSELYDLAMLLGLPGAFIGLGLFAVFLLASDLARAMEAAAARDPLTGVLNRRGFDEAVSQAIALARRHGWPLTLCAIDLDHFKAINDRYGHAAGDRALRRFAGQVGVTVRKGDVFARMGGEEFVLLLLNSPIGSVAPLIERVRADIELMVIDGSPPFGLTASFGIAELWPGEDVPEALLARADRALYRAKTEGRNCVRACEETPPDLTAEDDVVVKLDVGPAHGRYRVA